MLGVYQPIVVGSAPFLILTQNWSCLRLPKQSQSPIILESPNAYNVSTSSLYILLPEPEAGHHYSAGDLSLRHHGTCLCC